MKSRYQYLCNRFVTTGVSVKDAQLVDLINQAGVQIAVDIKGALPTIGGQLAMYRSISAPER